MDVIVAHLIVILCPVMVWYCWKHVKVPPILALYAVLCLAPTLIHMTALIMDCLLMEMI